MTGSRWMSIGPTNPLLLKGEALSSTASPSAPDGASMRRAVAKRGDAPVRVQLDRAADLFRGSLVCEKLLEKMIIEVRERIKDEKRRAKVEASEQKAVPQ